MMNNAHVFMRGVTRLAVVAAVLAACWSVVLLAVYGAVRLAERFGLC